MKFSDYHDSHGLSGVIRNPQTGENLHFHFTKGGDRRIYLQVNIAGTECEAYLTLAPRSTNHPDDVQNMVVHLVAPNGVPVQAVHTHATKAVVIPSGPSRPVLNDQNRPPRKDLDIDGAPMTQGHIQQNAPQQKLDPQLERMQNNNSKLGGRAVAEAMRDDSPPLPYQDQNARVDRDMGRKNATQEMLTGQTAKSNVPSYERVPSIAESLVPHRAPADDAAVHGEKLTETSLSEESEEVELSALPPAENPFDFAAGENLLSDSDDDLTTESVVTDPTVVPADPRIPGFNDSPAPNPDPNWGGQKVAPAPAVKPQAAKPQGKPGVQRSPSKR